MNRILTCLFLSVTFIIGSFGQNVEMNNLRIRNKITFRLIVPYPENHMDGWLQRPGDFFLNGTDTNFYFYKSNEEGYVRLLTTDDLGSIGNGGVQIYPSAGIPTSTGTAWGTSIVNNSAHWNTAYGWGDHHLMGYLTGLNLSQNGDVTITTPLNNQALVYSTALGKWINSTVPITGGTVTSVGLTMPSQFSITNSPVTTAGSLTAAWATQTQRLVFASPTGSTGVPTFRSLTANDIPNVENLNGRITGVATGLNGLLVSTAGTLSAVTNNSTNWNTAYGWGNHAGLYRPISYVPAWTDITNNIFNITSASNNQLLRYNSATNKWLNWTPNFLTTLNSVIITDTLYVGTNKLNYLISSGTQSIWIKSKTPSTLAIDYTMSNTNAGLNFPTIDAAYFANSTELTLRAQNKDLKWDGTRIKTVGDTVSYLKSPHFNGVPTAATAVIGTNTTRLATTAFANAAAAKAAGDSIQAAFDNAETGLAVSDSTGYEVGNYVTHYQLDQAAAAGANDRIDSLNNVITSLNETLNSILAILQAQNIDFTPPHVVSLVVENATPTFVQMTLDKNDIQQDSIPTPATGKITRDGVEESAIAVAIVDSVATWTFANPILYGEAILFKYTKPIVGTSFAIQDVSHNKMSSTGYLAVTNNRENVVTWSEEEYQAVYDAMTIKPGHDTAVWQNALVKTLVDDGIWPKLDFFYLFAQRTNVNGEAFLNWVDQTHNITDPGTTAPTFNKYQGVKFDGASDYLSTNFNVSDDGSNMAQNSLTIAAYCRATVLATESAIVGASNGTQQTQIYPYSPPAYFITRANSDGAGLVGGMAGSTGFFGISRISSSQITMYKNGSLLDTKDANSGTVVNRDFFVGANNNSGTAGDFCDNEISALLGGSLLNGTEHGQVNTAIETYMDHLGKGIE